MQYSHSTLLGAVVFTLVLYLLSRLSKKKRTPLKFIIIAGVAYFVVLMLRSALCLNRVIVF